MPLPSRVAAYHLRVCRLVEEVFLADENMPEKFVVATRRSLRGVGPTAVEIVEFQPGVIVLGATDPDRIVVEATKEAAARIRQDHGDRLMVESLSARYAQ